MLLLVIETGKKRMKAWTMQDEKFWIRTRQWNFSDLQHKERDLHQ